MNVNYTVENFEVFLLVLVRISGFIFVSPFFSLSSVPRKVKVGISVFMALLITSSLPPTSLEYVGVIGYAVLIVHELIAGILIGFSAKMCVYILNFSGQMIDMEIGFSMVTQLDPSSKIQTTITSTFYSNLVMLIMLLSDMHLHLIRAILDTFRIIPLGKIKYQPALYDTVLKFIANYFIIGFRIILPVFTTILIVNIILGILAKIAPQMNMFVVGMQLKVLIGLFVVFFVVGLLPQVTEFIFSEMRTFIQMIVQNLRE